MEASRKTKDSLEILMEARKKESENITERKKKKGKS